MKHLITKRNMSDYGIAAVIAVFAGLGLYVTTMPAVQADDSAASAGERIITIHDDSDTKGFITKEKTLRAALKEADIAVDENDRTEPSLDTELTANSYQVNIYRARTVVVKDGASATKIITSYRTGQQIVKQAKLDVHDEDILTLSTSVNPLTDGAAEVLTIRRATEFTFDFYGKVANSYTQEKTVGDMLRAKNITLGVDDVVVPGRETPIAAGMKVRLYRNGVQTVTQEEPVAFETEQIKDATRDKGYKEVKTAGKDGKRMVTYEVTVENGIEVSRKEINSTVTEEPVKQVEIVGTKVSLPAGSHEDWLAAAGVSSSDYGYVNYIFTRESGWNPAAANPSGYYGLGQTKLSTLTASCGSSWASNPVCQIGVFNSYAVGRYGSWSGAYEFWTANHWW